MKYTPKKFLEDVRSDCHAFGYPCFKVTKPKLCTVSFSAGKVASMAVKCDTGEVFEVICRQLKGK